jgi:hypothetical protein
MRAVWVMASDCTVPVTVGVPITPSIVLPPVPKETPGIYILSLPSCPFV